MSVKQLTQQLKEANEANEALMVVIEQLKHELDVERTKVRIPKELSLRQYNEIVAHCHKVREGFVKILQLDIPEIIGEA